MHAAVDQPQHADTTFTKVANVSKKLSLCKGNTIIQRGRQNISVLAPTFTTVCAPPIVILGERGRQAPWPCEAELG